MKIYILSKAAYNKKVIKMYQINRENMFDTINESGDKSSNKLTTFVTDIISEYCLF